MKMLWMLLLLLLSSICFFGQTASSPVQYGNIEILSDTQGVDFIPYLQAMSKAIRDNWYHLIPESAAEKKRKLAIEFAILASGEVADMRLVASSGDVALDRPAWGSITGSNPFLPLPTEFKGKYLALRLHFQYSGEKQSKSGVVVSISVPGSLQVPVGGSVVVTVTVTGTEEHAVEWIIKGSGCSGSTCGKMVGDLYVAPSVLPNPPEVILTAASKADPTAKASVTAHIVQRAPPQ